MKQSGARSAPGFFGGIWDKSCRNYREMKQSGARSAPGFFGILGTKKQQKHRGIQESGARARRRFWGYFGVKSSSNIGVRRGGGAPPRTAHILLLGVRMEGGPDLDPGFLRPSVRPFVRPFGFWSFFCEIPSVGNGFPSISMLLSIYSAAGPADFANLESISYANSPSRCVSAILVQNGSIFCQSRRLSSERDGTWNFQKLCASNRNRTLQLLVET